MSGPGPFGPFGDDDPEDAWDASDPPDQQLLVLARRLEYVAVVLYLLRVDHQQPNNDVRQRVLRAIADLMDLFADVQG